MPENISWARCQDITACIHSIPWPEDAIMVLERVPEIWLTEQERELGIQIRLYDAKIEFNLWERGRIFCEAFELRWEKMDGQFHVVLCGEPLPIENFSTVKEINLSEIKQRHQAYYLWGKKLTKDELVLVGSPSTEHVFLEMQIPRILKYPVSSQAQRVRVKVCEYFQPDNGKLVYYRFLGLEEIK